MENKNFKMDNLKEIREKKNMTQTRLSIEVGVSQEVISHYEIGQSKPNVENLIKLADHFKCTTDYLLGRTNNPTPIEYLDKKDLELADIITKYTALSNESKKLLLSYIDYLLNNDRTNEKVRDEKKKH